MPRIARVVAAGVPHHVTQRGNRRMDVFFSEEDRRAYLDLLAEYGAGFGGEFWGYCLMSNHVHLIAVPKKCDSLAQAIGGAHQAYTRRINFREGWRGYLWQGRFFSCPLDERHAERALCYAELNPVRARMARKPEEWRWSSAAAHAQGEADAWTVRPPFLDSGEAWRELLRKGITEAEEGALRRSTRTGRPLGRPQFIARLERSLKRVLQPKKPGPAARPSPRPRPQER